MRASFLLFAFLALSFHHVTAATVVGFWDCTTSSAPPAELPSPPITWSTMQQTMIHDPPASVLDYTICGLRSQDLRFVTHLRLVHYHRNVAVIDRDVPFCAGSNEKRQACLDQLAESPTACLKGSIPLRLRAQPSSKDRSSRTELFVSEGVRQDVLRFCSL